MEYITAHNAPTGIVWNNTIVLYAARRLTREGSGQLTVWWDNRQVFGLTGKSQR